MGTECEGLSMIDVIEEQIELGEYLNIDMPSNFNEDLEALCTASRNFQEDMEIAHEKGIRTMPAYLSGSGTSYFADAKHDMVLRMFEELGMPILHNGACSNKTACPDNYFWEYVPKEEYFNGCDGDITADCNDNVLYPVDVWLYDHRTTLSVKNEDFAVAYPDKAIISKQLEFWPIGGRLVTPFHAAKILDIVGPSISGASRLHAATPCQNADVSSRDHKLNGVAPGSYACYDDATHNIKYFQRCGDDKKSTDDSGGDDDATSYTPIEDVVSHSNMARDVADINAVIGTDNAEALKLYTEGKNREGKSLQGMATKDWAAAGADDAIKQQYETVLGLDYLDKYNLDAIQCNGSFQGKSQTMCSIATKKNLICTHLAYSIYEGEKAIANSSQKNWDELYAFWHGVFADGDPLFGKNTPHNVQQSRDGNYGTAWRELSFSALNEGKAALQADTVASYKIRGALEDFLLANAATFGGQATLKYAYEAANAEGDSQDKKWGEGYTYFRCGAGLLDEGLAKSIDAQFDPRGKASFPNGLFCGLLKEMIDVGDIGQGISVADLNILNFIPSAETDCGLSQGSLGEGGAKTDDSADDDDVKKSTDDSSDDDDVKKSTDDSSDDDDVKKTTDDSSDDDDSAAVSHYSLATVGATIIAMLIAQ